MRRFILLSILVGVSVCVAATTHASAATAQPGLTGETLSGTDYSIQGGTPGLVCNPDATTTFTLRISGVAAGPYPGTFDETVTVTIGPQPQGAPGSLTQLDATFTITSGTTVVTGTKQLTLAGTGACVNNPVVPGAHCPTIVSETFTGSVAYDAMIHDPIGTTRDRGTGVVSFTGLQENCVQAPLNIGMFDETFTSTGPASTPGKATGGGQVPGNVTFAFNAKSDGDDVKGDCNIVDRKAGVKVKCTDVIAYVQTGNHATFTGNATVNGIATTYRIDVEDGGEPGRGVDSFLIQTDTGYTAGGPIADGNVQVH